MKVILLAHIPDYKAFEKKLCLSVDRESYSEKPAGLEITKIRNRLAGKAAHTTTDIKTLAEAIANGQTIQGARLRDKSNPDEGTDERFIEQSIFGFDIDNDVKRADGNKYKIENPIDTPEQIRDILNNAGVSPCIIAPSYSSGKTDPDGNVINKWHVWTASDEPIKDNSEARQIILNLIDVVNAAHPGAVDISCKDPARIFFGSPPDNRPGNVFYDSVANSPESLLTCFTAPEDPEQQTLLEPEQETQPAQESTPRNKSKSAPSSKGKTGVMSDFTRDLKENKSDPDVLLFMVDVNALNYEEWRRVSAAYKLAGGSLDLFLQWSRGYTRGEKSAAEQERENKSTWNGLKGNGPKGDITIMSLHHFAEEHSPGEYNNYINALIEENKPTRSKRSKSKTSSQARENNSEGDTLEEIPAEYISNNPFKASPFSENGEKCKLSIENLKAALEILKIKVRQNVINHQIEYSGAGLKGLDPSGITAIIPHFVYNKLQYYLKGCTAEKIAAFLNVIAYSTENEYNPIIEMIHATQWDGTDRLEELYSLMHIDSADELSKILLKKWLMQAYCSLFNTLENPFAPDLTLVLVGKQGYGKTRLFQKLALNSKYFGEGISLDPRDKDSRMQSTAYWLAELGEIGSTMKKDINTLKAFLSNKSDTNRPPYGKSSVTYPRITCFCGTTNDMQFLIDETGNRRYATIKLPDDQFIDVNSKQFKEFNTLQLWAQIKNYVDIELSNGSEYANAFRLTRDEQAQLEERNKLHSKMLKGEQETIDLLNYNLTPEQGFELGTEYITVTNFKAAHSELSRYSSEQIGKVLKKIGYTPIRKKITGSVLTVYKLPYKKWKGNNYKQEA